MAQKIITGFKDDDGVDIGDHLVPKDYLIETYPGLIPLEKSSGLFFAGDKLFAEDNSIRYTSTFTQTSTGGTNWKIISSGNHHRSAIKTDGTLWSWGAPRNGDNTTLCRESPVQTIAGGNNWTCVNSIGGVVFATKQDGTLWGWGGFANGSLAIDQTSGNYSSPVQIGANTNWKTPTGIKTDGTLWSWGENNTQGQVGDNTRIDRSSPVQIGTNTNWKCVVRCLGVAALALKTDGTLWTWGLTGARGDGLPRYSSPVQVGANTNWKEIDLGNRTYAGIKTDGTLWVWVGAFENQEGQLGTNDTIFRSSPVQTIAGGTNWKYVSVAKVGRSIHALKTDGSFWAWGDNTSSPGKLGDGTTIDRSSPVQIGTFKSWKSISAGAYFVAAIKEFGEEY